MLRNENDKYMRDIAIDIDIIHFWKMKCNSGYLSYFDEPMNEGIDAMEAYKRIGVKPRDGDDPDNDDDSKFNYSFSETNFTPNGTTRYTAHNGTLELATDYKLYVTIFFRHIVLD